MKIDVMDGSINILRNLAINHAQACLDGFDGFTGIADPDGSETERLENDLKFYKTCSDEQLVNKLLIICGCAFQHPEYNYFKVDDWRS